MGGGETNRGSNKKAGRNAKKQGLPEETEEEKEVRLDSNLPNFNKNNKSRSTVSAAMKRKPPKKRDPNSKRAGDCKHYWHSVLFTHIFLNLVTFYSERISRPARILSLYGSIFTMIMMSGIFFIGKGEYGDTGGLSYNWAFTFGCISVGVN